MSPSKIKRLIVDTPQGSVGVLDKDSRFVFNYSLANSDRQREIALRMPIRAESYASTALLPIFAMNRPEGFLYNEIVRRMAKHAHVDDMLLLSIVGENQIGRLTTGSPMRRNPPGTRRSANGSYSGAEVRSFSTFSWRPTSIPVFRGCNPG